MSGIECCGAVLSGVARYEAVLSVIEWWSGRGSPGGVTRQGHQSARLDMVPHYIDTLT